MTSSPTDKLAGLDAGADDYVVKPFEIRDLDAHPYAPRELMEICGMTERGEIRIASRSAPSSRRKK
jgi:CheY-like chemotaxis protein